MSDEEKNENAAVTQVLIAESNGRFDRHVPVQVNGQASKIPVGVPTPVSEGVLDALRNADITFTEIPLKGGKDAAESGVGAAASAPITSKNNGFDEDDTIKAPGSPADEIESLATGDDNTAGALKVQVVGDGTADTTGAKTVDKTPAKRTPRAKKPAAPKA